MAVVVVAGVGDNPRTDAAERVANGLTLWAAFDPPEEHSEWYPVEGDRIQPVQRFATTSPGGAGVDLYEFWWADLSRFPAALRSFLAAFVGLFLAFPSIGRTALRTSTRITEEPQPPEQGDLHSRLDYHLLGLLAWLVAVPVVVLSATLLMVVGALVVAIGLPDANSITGAIVLGLYGVALAFVGLGLLRHYERRSERHPAFGLGVATLLAAVALCVWRLFERGIHGKSIQLAIADTVAVFIAYPVRILWLGVLTVVLLATVVLAVRFARAGRDGGVRRGRTVSAVFTLGFGPLGVATLMAILSAAVGAAGETVAKGSVWTGHAGTPLCLAQPDDWVLSRCTGTVTIAAPNGCTVCALPKADNPKPARCTGQCPGITAWDFGSRLLADSIYALAWGMAVALAALSTLWLVAFVRRKSYRANRDDDRQAGRLTRTLAVVESPWTCGFLLLVSAGGVYAAAAAWIPAMPFVHPGHDHSTWAPTVAAILGGSVTALLVLARLMGISPTKLAADGNAPGPLRSILDKAYDIATFLREPLGSKRFGHGVGSTMPRKRMLQRYSALMKYVTNVGYERVVFVAHSQGTILTTTLLAEDGIPLPGEVSLMTFGCPLRQLYLKRFPSQYQWVDRLADPATRQDFVKAVSGEWVNVATAGDPVGRTVFQDPPEPWSWEGSRLEFPAGAPTLTDLLLGVGGHTSYWTAPDLYKELERLIDAA